MGTCKLVVVLVLLAQLSAFAYAQGSKTTPPAKSLWQTLDGGAPFIVAHGGFSGLFPDSSSFAYNFATITSVPDLILWCDVQLTKDGMGICFPDIKLDNSSDISRIYPKRDNTYNVNGVKMQGYFPIDFTLKELNKVSLTQGIYSRSPDFDASMLQIQTVDDVSQTQPAGIWLNVQHDAFYTQHNLSMRSFVISASNNAPISHISSPEVKFLQGLAKPFASTQIRLVFRFLDQDLAEPSTNQTYGSLLKNLTFIKTFASGILVPKAYIWPVDASGYLLPHTSLVADAHKIGLEVYAADFANDFTFAYNYSYNPVAEYLSFVDNGDFSVDGVVSDFPITPSEARDCFAHVGKNALGQAKPLVISHEGASGDYPGCTDMAYSKAISDGADVIDCPVQMSQDGVPFCLGSINLMNNTQIGQTQFRTLVQNVNELRPSQGIFSFSLNWADIQGLTPAIYNPWTASLLYRNPKFRNAGKIISLSDFLALAKNTTSLSAVSIKIENAQYLAAKQGLGIVDAVLDALDKAGYNDPSAKKVMIQSSSSSVLKSIKGKKYELVYEVDETIRDADKATITDIKGFADAVVIDKVSVFPKSGGYLVTMTDIVPHLQSFNLSVYVQIFQNEVVSLPFDFFSDPVVEINSYVMGPGVDGVITDFPETAASYKRNLCLKMTKAPPYMSAVQAGALMQQISGAMPPALAPSPVLTVADVSEPPLPPVMTANATAPAAAAPNKTSANGQPKVTASALLSSLIMIFAAVMMF
ncbi:hypothetical protein Cgig2_017658 [Carnegiea gigantea]|uniref:glycerophosphodiester phosphodiesterase n=1 Tax=Carnegiea gigantea TaxID=171969 RepID=A0A9Q1KCI3_9CARY|nr:hypothetical protein Cgig2_017658 [Carnegiea gigantea]